MPMTAGMTGLPYRTYLVYEAVGVVAWAAIYIAIGVLARESWEVATQVVGVGGTIVFLGILTTVLMVVRRRAPAAQPDAES